MLAEKLRLDDKVALITGASRGVGEAVALAFAESGAKLVLAGRKLDTLEELAHRIYKAGGDATPVSANVGKTPDCEDLVTRTAARYGGLDILVSNAAANPHFGPTLECSEEHWEKTFQVNLFGAFYLSKLCVPLMEKRGKGAIVFNACYGGVKPIPGLGVYCVAEAGLIMLTKTLAAELASRGVRVNAVASGIVKTEFSAAIWKDELRMADMKRRVPMKRLAEPEEVAAAILYLASDASSFCAGSILRVDGGGTI